MSTKLTKDILSQFKPLETLNSDALDDAVNKVELKEFQKGDYIFRKGDRTKNHLYLYKGNVELEASDGTASVIKSGKPESFNALSHVIPRTSNAKARSSVEIIELDSDLLDIMLAWDQTGSFSVEELGVNVNEEDEGDWMTRILQTEVFHRIPPANIQAVFASMEDMPARIGDTIVKQDDEGDYFYIVKSGRCMVTRTMPGQAKEIKLAELNAGDSFGEEALISDAKRNATVTMLSAGLLSRLSKDNFLNLLNEPLLNKISFSDAKTHADNGAVFLDVRLPAEHQAAHIAGCEHIPLIFLRMKLNALDKSKEYILYCDTGRRSSAASFLLNERGFSTHVLENGLNNVPNEEKEGKDI